MHGCFLKVAEEFFLIKYKQYMCLNQSTNNFKTEPNKKLTEVTQKHT